MAESSRAKLIERAIPQERARLGTELESLRTCARGPVVGKKRKPKMGPMPKCRLTGEGASFTGTSQKGLGSGSKTWRKMGPILAVALACVSVTRWHAPIGVCKRFANDPKTA